MPRYTVTVEEIAHYEIEVEADSEDAAKTEAVAIWANSIDPDKDFGGSGQSVEAINVEELED